MFARANQLSRIGPVRGWLSVRRGGHCLALAGAFRVSPRSRSVCSADCARGEFPTVRFNVVYPGAPTSGADAMGAPSSFRSSGGTGRMGERRRRRSLPRPMACRRSSRRPDRRNIHAPKTARRIDEVVECAVAKNGALGRIRTSDPRNRNPMLYPAELRARGRAGRAARRGLSNTSLSQVLTRGRGSHDFAGMCALTSRKPNWAKVSLPAVAGPLPCRHGFRPNHA